MHDYKFIVLCGDKFILLRTWQSVTDYPSSVTGSARKPFGKGTLFGVRETTPPDVTRDLPITLRTKSRFANLFRRASTSRKIHICKICDAIAYFARICWI